MYKLMIVDDEKIIVDGLKNVIDWGKLGFIVISSARNGEEALQAIKENPPDLLITDIRMPVMDGLKLVHNIRNEGCDWIKVIILSGYEDFEYARNAMKLGIADYLLKPTDPDKLEELVLKIKGELDKEAQHIQKEQDLKTKLCKSLPLLKDKFLNSLINDCLIYFSDAERKGIINAVTEQMEDKSNERNVRICADIAVSIKKEYMNDLTLEKFAGEYFMTPNYLGSLFKKTMSISFKEYLTEIRMQKAKQLIELNRYKLYEVGEMVGYRNYEYFRKLFKQCTGINPSEK